VTVLELVQQSTHAQKEFGCGQDLFKDKLLMEIPFKFLYWIQKDLEL
jgi:hypothetical protein